jgi:hypothetical protein
MDTEKQFHRFSVSILFCLVTLLSACAAKPANTTPTPQVFPTVILPTAVITTTSTPQIILPTSTPDCVVSLAFVEDLTIPDDTVVSPGAVLDKQWKVKNTGTCNWDERFRLRLISGDALGAAPEQALYPVRAGMEATLRILFTAPVENGEYVSEWQAFDMNGLPFGDTFFIKILVQQ